MRDPFCSQDMLHTYKKSTGACGNIIVYSVNVYVTRCFVSYVQQQGIVI